MSKLKLDHDLDELYTIVDTTQQRLRDLVDNDPLSGLIPFWKQPGWTTPAEFFLVRSALVSIEDQVRRLERNIDVLLRGSSMVAPEG